MSDSVRTNSELRTPSTPEHGSRTSRTEGPGLARLHSAHTSDSSCDEPSSSVPPDPHTFRRFATTPLSPNALVTRSLATPITDATPSWSWRSVTSIRVRVSSSARRVTSTPTESGPCSLQSLTTGRAPLSNPLALIHATGQLLRASLQTTGPASSA